MLLSDVCLTSICLTSDVWRLSVCLSVTLPHGLVSTTLKSIEYNLSLVSAKLANGLVRDNKCGCNYSGCYIAWLYCHTLLRETVKSANMDVINNCLLHLDFHYLVNWFKKERRKLWANLLGIRICFGNLELTSFS